MIQFALVSRIELRKEGGRRRNTSGPRPLSAINDANFNAFDLLGIERGDNGQEKSYGNLLVPSRYLCKERKNPFQFSIEPNTELTNAHVLRNYAMSRYSGSNSNIRNNLSSTSALNSATEPLDEHADGGVAKFDFVSADT